jgi:hypothetical protein
MGGLGSALGGTSVRRYTDPGALPASGKFAGEVVQVGDDGDSKPALYQWSGSEWLKSADPDNVAPEVTYATLSDLSSQVDGTETVFDLGASPVTDTLLLFVCGLLMRPGVEVDGGDYTLATRYVTLHEAPANGTSVLAYFVRN